MALKTFVKISGITNLSDARYCAGMYVDLLGFELEEDSPKYVSPSQFSEITGWVSGPDFIGEFDKLEANLVHQVIENYPDLNWVEHSDIRTLFTLVKSGKKGILKIPVADINKLDEAIINEIQDHEISLHVFTEDRVLSESEMADLHRLAAEVPVLIGGNLQPDLLVNLPEKLGLKGIALDGGEEIKPGLKDFDELAEILEALEIED
ncbi:beta/alpha barrel domain-containing protein [Algoriphagus hitonicola]|uniref:Phosphoribosylanthranilate isomerase n=1 Tax=Algoriphagus hitonicola TaxID=435880 RepID=A0A1I2XAI5_9BACT|nr:phosphoribosylanthranilate isomerase [Algoriphagus hitonicola]SFH10515.1 phosphoribosylanthranilate isomerase [Algoriphagus hitonicola]